MAGRDAFEAGIIPYVEHLRELPFVERVLVPNATKRDRESQPDVLLKTASRMHGAQLEWSKSHLSRTMVEHMLRLATEFERPLLVFAPTIGGETARRFEEAGINYVDRAGNCHVRLGKQYVAHIEGRSRPRSAPKEKGLRPASLRVLFTLLADGAAIEKTVREVAASSAGVSPQTVTDVRKRLAAEGYVQARGRRYKWSPKGKALALDLLLAHYDVLAHKLIQGRYRTRAKNTEEVEAEVKRILGEKKTDWWWGGGAAMARQTGYYRGTQTLVYTDRPIGAQGAPVGFVPSEDGNVIIAHLPGASATPHVTRADDERTVHPLLVYLDLMSEGGERARDAAAEVRRTLFEGDER